MVQAMSFRTEMERGGVAACVHESSVTFRKGRGLASHDIYNFLLAIVARQPAHACGR